MADNAAPVFLLTRPRAQSERFAQQMRDVLGAQADIRIHSLQEIQALDVQVDLTGIAALAFTSENGARVFADQSTRRDLPAYCVGDRTAATATELGFAAFSAGGTVDDLADLIVAAKPQGRVLHLQGKHKAGDLVAALTAQGVNAAGFEIYDQRALPVAPALHALLLGQGQVVAPIFSPRNAALFSQAVLGAEMTVQLLPIAISAATRDALAPEIAAICETADHPSGANMLQSLSRHISP